VETDRVLWGSVFFFSKYRKVELSVRNGGIDSSQIPEIGYRLQRRMEGTPLSPRHQFLMKDEGGRTEGDGGEDPIAITIIP